MAAMGNVRIPNATVNQRGGQHHASDGCWRNDRGGDKYDVMCDDGDDAWRDLWWKASRLA